MPKTCLGSNCPKPVCERCSAGREEIKEKIENSIRTTGETSPSGYHSSGGLIKVTNPETGKKELHYGKPYIE